MKVKIELKKPVYKEIKSLDDGIFELVILDSSILSKEEVLEIFTKFKNLEKLSIHQLNKNIKTLLIEEFPNNLSSLEIRNSQEIVSIQFPKPCYLEELSFQDCYNLTLTIENMQNFSGNLKKINLKNVLVTQDDDIRDFSPYWSKLIELDLSECKLSHGITASSLKYISNNCTSLEILKLNNCSKLMSNEAFSCITELPNLKSLELTGCEKLDLEAMQYICSCCNLESLIIGNNLNLFSKDEELAVEYILRIESLKELGIAFVSLKEKSYVDLAKKIEKLDVSWTKINDFALKKISKTNENLKELNITRCSKISDWGLKDLVKYWNGKSQLKKLIVKSGTNKRLEKGIISVKEKWKNCSIIETNEEFSKNYVKPKNFEVF